MRYRKRGMTIVEVLVALGVFAVAFFAVLGVMGSAYTATVQARDTTVATQLAREYIERFRKTSYAQLTSVPAAPVTASGVFLGSPYTTTFQRRLDVASALSGAGTLLTATVTWQSSNGGHAVELRTIVAGP